MNTNTDTNTDTNTVAAPVAATPAAPTVVFPDGEFTCKMLMNATGKSQPTTFLVLKKAIQDGLIKEVRRERIAAKGRPTVVYSKV